MNMSSFNLIKFDECDNFSKDGKTFIKSFLKENNNIMTFTDLTYCFHEYGEGLENSVQDFIDILGAYYSKDLEEVLSYVIVNGIVFCAGKLPNGNILSVSNYYKKFV